MVLLETFTIGLIFARQSKQGAVTTCTPKYLDQFLTGSHFYKTIKTRGCNPMFRSELHISCLRKNESSYKGYKPVVNSDYKELNFSTDFTLCSPMPTNTLSM